MRSNASPVIRRRLACDPAAPALARAEIAQVALSRPARADATLVVSELVTNAGFGLQLVDAVCAQWGTEHGDGRLVWARVAA